MSASKEVMSLRVGSNVPSMIALRRMDETRQVEERETQRLSSGDRIQRAAYDPSGLAISETMRARSRSYQQANRNATDGVSLLQVAEGSLGTIQELGTRLKELAMQSANDTYSQAERTIMDREFRGLVDEIKRVTLNTEFNGTKLLDGSANLYDLQVGIHGDAETGRLNYDLKKVLASFKNLSVSGLGVGDKSSAQTAVARVNSFIQQVSSGRAYLGSFQNRLVSVGNNLSIADENTQASRSKIRDADYAQSSAERVKSQINGEAARMMLQKTTQTPAMLQRLLD